MVKYLIVQLDDTSISFCHYANPKAERNLIPLEILKDAILFGLKENVIFQFVYPNYKLPSEYYGLINSVYHADIISAHYIANDIIAHESILVSENISDLTEIDKFKNQTTVLRFPLNILIGNKNNLKNILGVVERLTIIITDVEHYKDNMNDTYSSLLQFLAEAVTSEYSKKHYVQLNLLTDRLLLKEMNNCNAGSESITLCPDGRYYPCPAFYLHNDGYTLGNVRDGVTVKNPQLYKISRAPICRLCDCWQCKRCVWLNYKLTREINTPSHQQCVIAHVEREASRNLLKDIRELDNFLPGTNIDKLDYLDPFDLLV